MSKKELTPKQQLFCSTYLANGFNATQAAFTAGYSEDTAMQTGYENLKKPYIREYLDNQINVMLGNKKELTKQLIDKWCAIAFYENEGLPEDAKYKPTDILKASELLGKYLTLFVDKQEIDIKTNVIITSQDAGLL